MAVAVIISLSGLSPTIYDDAIARSISTPIPPPARCFTSRRRPRAALS